MRNWIVGICIDILIGVGSLMMGQKFVDAHGTKIIVVALAVLLVAGFWDTLTGGLANRIWPKKWINLEHAARFFRDEADRRGMASLVEMIDGFIDEDASENPVAAAFRIWLMEGMNDGLIEVWGTPLNGGERIKLSPNTGKSFDFSTESILRRAKLWDFIEDRDGGQYNDLLIRRSGITKFLQACLDDDKGRPKRRIEPRVDIG